MGDDYNHLIDIYSLAIIGAEIFGFNKKDLVNGKPNNILIAPTPRNGRFTLSTDMYDHKMLTTYAINSIGNTAHNLFRRTIRHTVKSKSINCVDVNTTSGLVRGQTIKLLDKSIDQFLGIPYAVPPLGSLRFAKPEPIKDPLPDIIDATKPKHSCMQTIIPVVPGLNASEDCLVLNIWSPSSPSNESKAVMFWIHGGALVLGSVFQDYYDGSVLATHDVVIVSTNYRLGLFGFLYGDREDAPGNVGFYDQLLALKWVRDNIHAFGGDRDQITIFGEDAGSWSVSAHILSPLSKGLFKRAIMQSGAHMYNKDRDVVSKLEALSDAKQLAKRLNCSETEDWLQCLRKVKANELSMYSKNPTFPVLGNQFLPISAQKAFADNKFNSDIDLMAGVTRDEGSVFISGFVPNIDNMTLQDFMAGVKALDVMYHGIEIQEIAEYYHQNSSWSLFLRYAFSGLTGDIIVVCPTYTFAKQFAIAIKDSHRVYFYQLRDASEAFAPFMKCDINTMGICHGMDIPFVFGLPFIRPGYLPKDVDLSKRVMDMWTKFAKTG
ncbi:unnamed protein product [Oppiella nova]|uniref:Carboxylesterase type B domain-containing protein n=1 Tax=Oppiella nova TaxID=334625 RepID=A0A7R9MCT1_9ACAR|nr:unnamed protein product [Oppiella nova]CAG2174984.1 unnamed protein product [Oppiella nova]